MENYSLVRMLLMVEMMKYGTWGMPRSCIYEFIKRVVKKKIRCEAYGLFTPSLITSIVQEHEC